MAKIAKARYLHGTLRRRSDRHKHESHAHYPGRSAQLPQGYRHRKVSRWEGKKSADAVVVAETGAIKGRTCHEWRVTRALCVFRA